VAGNELDWLEKMLRSGVVRAVSACREYDPGGVARSTERRNLCAKYSVDYREYEDSLMLPIGSVCKPDGSAYLVYGPYARRWHEIFESREWFVAGNTLPKIQWLPSRQEDFPSRESLDIEQFFESVRLDMPHNPDWTCYADRRDRVDDPNGTTSLSVALRLGAVGPRECAILAKKQSTTLLGELVWREFFTMLLSRFPASAHTEFREKYRGIAWSQDSEMLDAWQEGKTGFPLVDAGMRELAATGHMHNRIRMLTANVATKLLRLDWRLGERVFAEQLLDYDSAINLGNWQWSAGTGADAAPYFRVFNPEVQRAKFDPLGEYVRKWLPENSPGSYPLPIVDYRRSRGEYLEWWKSQT